MTLFDRILAARGLDAKIMASFLSPDYSIVHDPYLLNDMEKAVKRLTKPKAKQEKILIYGDYDIDGLTASALLLDSLKSFGFKHVDIFIPNRFVEGYGLTTDAVEDIASKGAKLIITVDCGSSSQKEIVRANELGVDVVVTDHHTMSGAMPPAVAVINPKRPDNVYPFADLAGVGVAFKLVQALQAKLKGLPEGQEKWLLDLVALGTVCDVVPLVNENRTYVYWGLKVLAQTKRPGLKALMAIAGIDTKNLNSRSLGFGIGPRMNAAGRLETARHALEMLTSDNPMGALEKAELLESMNKTRRLEQGKIMKSAVTQAEKYSNNSVLVVSHPDWNHGIVGIVAAKLLEKYKKPVFVLQELGDESKGSARSYGDFSAIDAVNSVRDVINGGGGHRHAAGVTMPTTNIEIFRKRINKFYDQLNLKDQQSKLLPKADATAELNEITEDFISQISQLEPFGIGNPQPILKTDSLLVKDIRKMGADAQHAKLELCDDNGKVMQFLAFSAPDNFFVDTGARVSIWYHPDINEWQGKRSVEGRLLHIEVIE